MLRLPVVGSVYISNKHQSFVTFSVYLIEIPLLGDSHSSQTELISPFHSGRRCFSSHPSVCSLVTRSIVPAPDAPLEVP
ncbi:unnamed protein product [Penicillium salamii]|nr:unnamed protein product [Penicillium salamii]